MDDIQFWVYLLFGLLYIITRALRKKRTEDQAPPAEGEGERPRRREAKSFEELLREFTEAGAEREEAEQPTTRPASTPVSRRVSEEQQRSKRRRSEFEREGETRHFADDESRRVYEESIRQAEGADLSYERDEHFKISRSLQSKSREQRPETQTAREVRGMLSSPDSAKKAIILAEILNRKY